jgi:hypothetical protein
MMFSKHTPEALNPVSPLFSHQAKPDATPLCKEGDEVLF